MKLIPPMRVVVGILLILIIFLNIASITIPYASAQPTWPQPWIEIDWDKNEDGPADDWRDVEYAYYQYDSDYLYLKLECYSMPGSEWPSRDGRYKWFIDLDGNMYYGGGNIFDAEYLIFIEDVDHNGVGEMYLVSDVNNDNNFGEYEPWPPTNYADFKITDTNVGGWRIVSPDQIEMYISWTSIGTPLSYGLFWSTDQQNPNLDQGPTTDRVDEEQVIIVHNVAAVGQTPTPTNVSHGEHVTVQVAVENKGTQTETFNVTCYFNNTIIGTELVANLSAGHQTTLDFDWDTTGLPESNYTITAWADSSAAITETDEEDNWCTSPAIVTVGPAPVHDVAAVSQIPDSSSVPQGTTVNITVTVSNFGDFVETFNVTCFFDNSPIDYQTITNLVQKASTNLTFAWDTTEVDPNTYYIRAMADSSNIIDEIDEDNNCTKLEAVTVYSGDGKLFVDKVKTDVISGEDPPVVGLSTTYEMTIIVTNTGGSNVSNIKVNETISSDVTFVDVGTPSQGSVIALPPPKIVWDVGTLAPGANATLTLRISVIPASTSLVYLNHKEEIVASGIDTLSGTLVSDSGDTDITVFPIIRDVAAISQVPSSSVVCQGDTIVIDVTVKNLGNVSETFDVACYYDSNLISVMRVYNLEAGSQTVVSFAWDTTGIPTATYSINAEADSSYEITESNETNNICTSPAAVKIVIHDVAIISQAPSLTTVTQGKTVTIEVVVKNEGTEPETFTVTCYYNETLFETKTVTNLEPNTTMTLNFVWNTTGVPIGTYFINTAASTVPGEKDTDDNACRSTTSIMVTAPPHADFVWSPFSPLIFEDVTFDASNSTPNGGIIVGYEWNFGDGHADSGKIVVHQFLNWGTFTVTLNVTDSEGEWDMVSKDITVRAPPHANFTWSPSYPRACHDNVTFDASTSTPNGGDIISYEWNFGDGSPIKSGRIVIHKYDKPDTYEVTLTVTDSEGESDTAKKYIEVTDTCIGGSTVSLKSSLLPTWISLNVMLIAAIFITSSWVRKRRMRTE